MPAGSVSSTWSPVASLRNNGGDQAAPTTLDVDEALKRIALEKAKKAANEKFLKHHLASLERYQEDIVSRWTSINDFDKVDLVCAELLRNSGVVAALQYMEKVRSLVDAICLKLLPKAIQEGYEQQEQQKSRSLRGGEDLRVRAHWSSVTGGDFIATPSSASTALHAAVAGRFQPPSPDRRHEAEARALRLRLEQQASRSQELERELKQAQARLSSMEKERSEEKAKIEQREAEVKAAAARQANKAAELSAMMATAESSRRSEVELRERLDRAQADLQESRESLRRQERMSAHLRTKLQAAEGQLRGEQREESQTNARIEIAQGEIADLEKQIREERSKNLKAVKGKNKEIESLRSRLQELEKQLSAANDSLAQLQKEKQENLKSVTGEVYTKHPWAGKNAPTNKRSATSSNYKQKTQSSAFTANKLSPDGTSTEGHGKPTNEDP